MLIRSHRARTWTRRVFPHQVQPPHPQLDRRPRRILLDLPRPEHRHGSAETRLAPGPDQHARE